ncbi:MAG: hypothetical protein NVSMB40_01860 [Aquirhabdus sp.]
MISDVSVVIPYYNAENTILRALESIKKQTVAVKEVIIVNDGSDFARLCEIAEAFHDSLNIILIDLGANFGASHARNTGISKATGTYIAFLDADDAWHPEKISIQYEFMCHSGAYLSCHGYVFNLNLQSMHSPSTPIINKRKLTKLSYTWKNHAFTPTVMAIKDHFIDFDTRLSRMEDLKCWIENLKNGKSFFLEIKLAGGYKNPIGESGLSGSYSLMHKESLSAWRLLFKERKVSFLQYFMAVLIEQLKYPIRVLIILKNQYST